MVFKGLIIGSSLEKVLNSSKSSNLNIVFFCINGILWIVNEWRVFGKQSQNWLWNFQCFILF